MKTGNGLVRSAMLAAVAAAASAGACGAMAQSPASSTSPGVAPVQGTALQSTAGAGQRAAGAADTGNATPTSTAPAQPGQAAASKVDSAHYVIGPEDVLQVTVWREPTLSGSMPVRPDGMITLVLIGDLKASGRTPMQLGEDIADRLRHYIQDPVVSVAVTADTSQRIYMVGEVGHVGPIPLSPGMTPLQAISTAGGPNPYAHVNRIYILRGTGARQQKIPFNYKQALKGDARQSPALQPGDTIVVP